MKAGNSGVCLCTGPKRSEMELGQVTNTSESERVVFISCFLSLSQQQWDHALFKVSPSTSGTQFYIFAVSKQ
jgi:hypothetical protein